YVSGRLGLLLAIPPGYATAVWAPSGIALAAVLLGGYRVWPGILLGSFCVNVGTSFDASTLPAILKSLTIATSIGGGAALEAVAGAFLIRRLVGYSNILTQEMGSVRMLLLGGPVACTVNASIGIGTLWAAGFIPTPNVPFNWWTWWVGDTIGVLIFTPLVLIWWLRPWRAWLRLQVLVTIPLVVMFALVVVLFFLTSNREKARIQSEFDKWAKGYAYELQQDIENYFDILNAVEGLYASSEQVDRDEFAAFSTRMLSRRPEVLALSWNPLVRREARAGYENAIRAAGFPDFRIRERDGNGQLVVAGERDEYVPVGYIEPFKRNAPAMGLDVSAEIVRRQALYQARDTGLPVATGVIQLVQQAATEAGLIMYMPIYHDLPATPSVHERRRALQGYGAMVFPVEGILRGALDSIRQTGLQVRIYDETTASTAAPIYRGNVPDGALVKPGGLDKTTMLDMAGRRWRMEFHVSPDYLVAHRSWQAWTLLAAGLLFTSLLGLFLLVMVGRTAKIEELIAISTTELQQANAELKVEIDERKRVQDALKASTDLAHSIIESASDSFVAMDADGTVRDWNRQAENTFGWSREEVLGRLLEELIIPTQHRQAHQQGLKHYLETGEGPVLNKRIEITA
ncbi:MAG: CHASE domain-containing protein, partial [Nevskiales bacterium]